MDQECKKLFSEYPLRYDLGDDPYCLGDPTMPAVRLVDEEEAHPVAIPTAVSPVRAWSYIVVSALLVAVIGTWLVWFSAVTQRNLQEQDIRAACQRTMPDTAERCFDTVVIQRGGVRR